ncbi:hypothetical protein [Fodinibius sp. Rm-B-1B1-1]|uniref:hypothetical protein n=1 Tax=Fodinibius alkaliphilus TaxID=3140241 RepID=UPI003159F580
MNNQVQINAEIEYHAVSIAQNEIDQIKWIKSESALNDHLNKFPQKVPLTVGNDTLFYNVNIDIADITIPNSNIKNKKVSVRVSNKFLKNNSNNNKGNRNIELGFIKSFN